MVKAISNVFEVGSSKANYTYVEDLGDGRGFTATSYGFCTDENEMKQILTEYNKREPGNALSQFLPRLANPVGFSAAWNAEARSSPVLHDVCEKYADEIYYDPAVQFASDAKIITPVGLAIIYDTLLQHGGGTDPDSLGAIYKRTVAKTGWPNTGTELDFLRAFLDMRRADLMNPKNAETRDVWRQSVTRIDALVGLLNSNPNLQSPVVVRNSVIEVTI